MAGRDKTTLGLALFVTLLATMAHIWLQILLVFFAVFLLVWGREGRRTEAFIGRLPGGNCAFKILEQIDLVISPRDHEYQKYISNIVEGYNDDLRASLRIVFSTRNSSRISAQHLDQFTKDGLIEYPHNGPGSIKTELRDIVSRTLDELGL